MNSFIRKISLLNFIVVGLFMACPKPEPEINFSKDGLKFEINETQTWTVYGDLSNSDMQSITVPEIANEKPVTHIGDNAFSSFSRITTVTLPQSITKIENYAFSNCSLLKTITINAKEPPTADRSFLTLTNALAEIRVPDESVEKYRNDKTWGKFADKICGLSWPSSTIEKDGLKYTANYIEKSWSVSVAAGFSDEYLRIPAEFNSWPVANMGANETTNIQSFHTIEIPTSITKIDANAFAAAAKLEYIMLDPTTPPAFGSFAVGTNVKEIRVPMGTYEAYINDSMWKNYANKICEYGLPSPSIELGDIRLVADYKTKTWTVYGNNINAEEITIPSFFDSRENAEDDGINWQVTKIGSKAFFEYRNLKKVIIPEGIVEIGEHAFYNCVTLTDVTLPESLETIGDYAFCLILGQEKIKIGSKIKSIGKVAFKTTPDESKIKELTINAETPPILGNEGYGNFNNYCIIRVPDESVDTYRASWSSRSSYIIGITWPNDMIIDGDYIYKANYETKTFSIAAANKEISGDITIPNEFKGWKVTSIENRSFQDCDKITSVIISENISSIGYETFRNCSILKKMIIKGEISKIYERTFSYATEEIELKSINPPIISSDTLPAFYRIKQIIVPDGYSQVYQEAPLWSEYKTKIKEASWPNYEEIDGDFKFTADFFTKTWSIAAANKDIIGVVIIPETFMGWNVTKITSYGFSSCNKITQIELASTITKIGDGSFCDCTSLETLIVPAEEMTIAEFCFSTNQNYTLKKIIVPEVLVEAYRNANNWKNFANKIIAKEWPSSPLIQGDFTFTANYMSKTWSVAASNNEISGEIIIPEQIEGWNVTEIGYGGFRDLQSVTSFELPSTITSIKSWAFSGCTNITTFKIHSEQVPTTESSFIQNHPNLKEIRVKEELIENYRSDDNWKSFGTKIIALNWPESTIIQDNFKFTANYETKTWAISAANSELTGDITIPEQLLGWKITEIDKEGFRNSSKIASVTINENITKIRGGFYNSSITELIINSDTPPEITNWSLSLPDTFSQIVVPEGKADIYQNANVWSSYKRRIKEPSWPDYMTIDGNLKFRANFYDKTAEVSLINTEVSGEIVIPDNLQNLKVTSFRNFSNTKNITSVTIGNNITEIPSSAFSGCTNLATINIPNSVLNIGSYAFMNCEQLKTVNIPSSLAEIKNGTFYNCKSLETVEIPATVTKLGYQAFYLCASLDNVTLPDSIKVIEQETFRGCSNLRSVELPETLQRIENLSFSGCSKLTQITIPESVNFIGESSFSGCKNLTQINIPSLVTTIEGYTFANCSSLEQINIPETITSFGEGAFLGCSKITQINIPNAITRIENNTFNRCSELKDIILPENLTYIGSYAFSECQKLENITIPESVSVIGAGAFNWCLNLSQINIPNSLTVIEESTFKHTKLSSITIPSSVKEIKAKAFHYCSRLTSISLPELLESIGELAFYNTALSEISLPSSLKSIGADAFSSSRIGALTLPENLEKIHFKSLELNREMIITILATTPPTVDYTGYNISEIFQNMQKTRAILVPESSLDNYKSAFGWSEISSKFYPIEAPSLDQEVNGIKYKGYPETRIFTLPNQNRAISGKVIISSPFENWTIPLISDESFSFCENISEIILPESTTTIGDRAFYECKRMEKITIQKNLIEIGDGVFYNNVFLREVIIHATTPPTVGINNSFSWNLQSIKVPAESVELYKAAEWWSKYADKISPI
ncbi:MAG: leucine-rich repeat protein [Spirochaetales bacterium]|nr:leucine-rich repeat protein [Spirochaetales bacterium]